MCVEDTVKGFSLRHGRQAPPKGQAGSALGRQTESLASRPESQAGNHSLHGVLTAAPSGAAGNDMARPEQGAQGTPKFQQCASGRRGVPLTAWMECEVPSDSSSVHPKDRVPPTP